MKMKPTYGELEQKVAFPESALATSKKESLKDYKSLVDRLLDGIYHYDLQSREYTLYNKRFLDLFQTVRGNRNVATNKSVLLRIHPEHRDRVRKAAQASLATGCQSGEVEYFLLHPDGSLRWMHDLWYVVRDQTGTPVAIEGIVRDKTKHQQAEEALRKSEALLRAAIENAPIAMVVSAGPKETVIGINRQFTALFGYTLADIPDVSAWWPRAYPDKAYRDRMRSLWAKEMERSRAEQTPFRPVEATVTCKDGSTRDVGVQVASVDATNLVAFVDLTERKRVEKEKEDFEARLRQAYKMEAIETLTGGIAHEFNNILGIILGNTELAMDDIPQWNPTREFLLEIRNASLRAKEVVKQLLNFSRKPSRKRQPADLARIIKVSLDDIRTSIANPIQFKEEASETRYPVIVDQTQIHRVIINLCRNAAQAMGNREGAIEIRLGNAIVRERQFFFDQVVEPGEYVGLTVADTGHGIPADVIERIFDPFYTTRDVEGGSGLGLSVVYGIIRGHDGFIRIESQPETGTTVACFFPATGAAPAEIGKPNDRLPAGKETILLIDDDVSLAKMVRLSLERLGYGVETHTDPREAVERFNADPEKYHLVITDMTMPQMTGDQVVAALLNLRADIKIIICTGYSKQITAATAVKTGARDYIMKPIDRQILAETVRKVLDADRK